ncbi:transcriptional repressor [Peptoniphilus sp. GNH]|nr:transcriptional regulator, Fur family [Clostridiales bacterium KA00134]UHR03356.1 transcriptional repressor [Peptoniphilus sp. GNH]
MKKDYEEIVKNILRENGYKFTNQRKDIYKVFVDNVSHHLTTEEVYKIAKKANPEVGIATVYRTILLFEKLGIIYKISFDDGAIRYELKSEKNEHRHHHLICLSCNKVIEVKLDLLDALESSVEKSEKFKIVDHNLKFYGYCSDCQKKKEK